MKLVEILANELSEWPCDGPATQDPDKEIRFDRPGFDFFANSLADDAGADIGEGVEVTREMWQAERDRQKGGEWKRARGSKPKYETETPQRMEVRHRDGDITQGWTSQSWNWSHNDGCPSADIMAWRIISQPQAEEVEVKDTTIGTLSYKVEIDTSPAIKALNELSAKWDQVESPFKWRDTVNELNAYIEEFTREREALINRLALEGFALIPAMTPVMGVADISLPIEEWQIGDIVEVVSVSDESSAPLGVFKITDIDASEPKYELDDQYFPNHDQMKFVHRP